MEIEFRQCSNIPDDEDFIEDCSYNIGKAVSIILEEELKLTNLRSSVFGNVLLAKMPRGDEDLAVKIVTNENIFKSQLTEWPKLKHAHILALIYSSHVPHLDLHIFVTQSHPYNLDKVILSERSYNRVGLLELLRKWLHEILDGLRYLHQKNLCLMGLNTKNILLSKNYSAVIADFNSLDSTKNLSNRYNVPYECRPPETFKDSEKAFVDGVAFDMWCFGILALKVFTFEEQVDSVMAKQQYTCWWSDVYPGMLKKIESKNFKATCKNSLPECRAGKENVMNTRNFITTCLRLRPSDRPSAKELMEHKFLKKTGWLSKPVELWENKVNMSSSRRSRKQNVIECLKKFGQRSRSKVITARQFLNSLALRIRRLGSCCL